jgi:hypothetical protein
MTLATITKSSNLRNTDTTKNAESTVSWFQGLQFAVDICGIVNACYQSLIGSGKCKAAYEITLLF